LFMAECQYLFNFDFPVFSHLLFKERSHLLFCFSLQRGEIFDRPYDALMKVVIIKGLDQHCKQL
jgi:hypothetical protein